MCSIVEIEPIFGVAAKGMVNVPVKRLVVQHQEMEVVCKWSEGSLET